MVTVPPMVGAHHLTVDINHPDHRPRVPAKFAVPGTNLWGLYKITVSADGTVRDASAIKSAGAPAIDDAWIAKIKTWRYRPLVIDGKPVAFAYVLRLQVHVDE
jgi:TonB family protein